MLGLLSVYSENVEIWNKFQQVIFLFISHRSLKQDERKAQHKNKIYQKNSGFIMETALERFVCYHKTIQC